MLFRALYFHLVTNLRGLTRNAVLPLVAIECLQLLFSPSGSDSWTNYITPPSFDGEGRAFEQAATHSQRSYPQDLLHLAPI